MLPVAGRRRTANQRCSGRLASLRARCKWLPKRAPVAPTSAVQPIPVAPPRSHPLRQAKLGKGGRNVIYNSETFPPGANGCQKALRLPPDSAVTPIPVAHRSHPPEHLRAGAADQSRHHSDHNPPGPTPSRPVREFASWLDAPMLHRRGDRDRSKIVRYPWQPPSPDSGHWT